MRSAKKRAGALSSLATVSSNDRAAEGIQVEYTRFLPAGRVIVN